MMNSFNKTWNKSYSESDLMTSSQTGFASPIRSPVMIRRTVCMEEVIPSFIPFETAYNNTFSSPHRRKNSHQYKTSLNLTKPESLELQIANLNLTNSQFSNQSFSAFSFTSPKALDLTGDNIISKNVTSQNFKSTFSEIQPMEVDSFKDSKNNSKCDEFFDKDCVNNVDINCLSPIISQENNLRMRNLRVQSFQNSELCDKIKTDKKLPKSFFKKVLMLILILTIFLFGGSFIFLSYNYFEDNKFFNFKEFSLDDLKRDLTAKVYNQDHVIHSIINSVKSVDNFNQNQKLLAFFGAHGVGKTFITNILKENLPKNLVHEIDGGHLETNEAKEKILTSLTTDNLNLILIHDIKNNSTKNLVHFIKSTESHKKVVIVAIFSTIQVDENLGKTIDHKNINNVENELKNHDINYEIVLFNSFSQRDVKVWIGAQLFSRLIPLELHEKITDNVMEDYDIELNGLKGLHSRLVLELKNFVE